MTESERINAKVLAAIQHTNVLYDTVCSTQSVETWLEQYNAIPDDLKMVVYGYAIGKCGYFGYTMAADVYPPLHDAYKAKTLSPEGTTLFVWLLSEAMKREAITWAQVVTWALTGGTA